MKRILLLIAMMFSLAAFSQQNPIVAKYIGLIGQKSAAADQLFKTAPDEIIQNGVGFGSTRVYYKNSTLRRIHVIVDDDDTILTVQIEFHRKDVYRVAAPFYPYSKTDDNVSFFYDGLGSITFIGGDELNYIIFEKEWKR